MGHSHDHGHSKNKKALLFAFLLTTSFMIAEVIGGFVTNSLALLSDAGHMLSDAVSLALSLLAFKLGEKTATAAKTYGYKRVEMLAALCNGVVLIVISVYIFIEAIRRFKEPVEIASNGMLIIAVLGLLINILSAWILMRGGDVKGNLNLRSAFLHVLGDLLGSVGAIIAALLIKFFGWTAADAIASILVSILVIISGWRVTRDTVHILMEGAPQHINVEEVKSTLLNIPVVKEVHDLHIWSVTSDFQVLTCHLIIKGNETQSVLKEATDVLKEKFHVEHVTIQVEIDGEFNHSETTCKV
ncbi:cation diffusion facilitator family transporter [Bacillus pacificus]|uniref:cation diffusion facilitator family transporter n=1 Tax=Bacillus TaxID=1386 RepID=UPI000944C3E5|nr:cation diffusion facilitator family transporter [Bacillus pacificus]MCC2414867.1 cation diffusion facilitator family transporter [Bacillus pacificus]MCU5005193.1 cation diffusion facilitator family transporter [Bacillus pacificus]MCU5257680.1 cation diffusion facilitator family transporter [Bacillus pacificus]MCU5559256.1 cation diffusion facilitator family transporter [Bacillus pacificus]MED0825053.1 cation diffusion facilitator family transporter [Bacillus pacificus]